MKVFDQVLDSIELHIAKYQPEKGGLLFGPIGRDVVSLFIPDEQAHTSSMTYTISKEMCDRVPIIENDTNLEYKGIIHSHPGLMDGPSLGDRDAAQNALRLNPHMGKFFMPIFTGDRGKKGSLGDHEISITKGKISAYVVMRQSISGNEVEVRKAHLFIVPLLRCIEKTCEKMISDSIFESAVIVSNDASTIFDKEVINLSYVLNCDAHEYIIIAGESFPQYAPHILHTNLNGDTTSVTVEWNINCDPVDCMVLSIKKSLEPNISITHTVKKIPSRLGALSGDQPNPLCALEDTFLKISQEIRQECSNFVLNFLTYFFKPFFK